jgi:AAA+ ATPase superfamily predicted ATPase
MDPRKNPYAPGAGSKPPELAGRDCLIESAAIALDRIREGRSARSLVLYGLRGVGKTVLLNKIRLDAEARGFATVLIESPEGRSLPSILVPPLRAALFRLSRGEKIKAGLERSLRALAGFAKALKVKYGDVEIGVEFPAEAGLADSGDLQFDLIQLFSAIGEASSERRTAIVLFVDELQYVPEAELGALVSALHRMSQEGRPVAMIGAGLPQLLGQLGEAKSYAERLFEYVEIGRLDPAAARSALVKPAEDAGASYTEDAVEAIIEETGRYPYFLQEWGKHAWDLADRPPITRADVARASRSAIAALDASFFRVRFDRLSPAEKRYLRAMAELGAGAHRSGDIAEVLKRPVTAVAPTRTSLIRKGMIYSLAHGDTAFTVPLFDSFMRRIMPEMPA